MKSDHARPKPKKSGSGSEHEKVERGEKERDESERGKEKERERERERERRRRVPIFSRRPPTLAKSVLEESRRIRATQNEIRRSEKIYLFLLFLNY